MTPPSLTFTLRVASNDAGFNCAWNQSSDKFAVACQDGYVCVWDIRSSEKLAKIQSKQNPQVKGACRSVKFSPSGSIDLLMFSEVRSLIHRSIGLTPFLSMSPTSISWTRGLSTTDRPSALHRPTLTSTSPESPFPPTAKPLLLVRSASVPMQFALTTPDVGMENVIMEYDVDTILRRTFPFGSVI